MRTQSKIPATIRRIVLTGFMGAGKSTIGPLLARRLAWDFVDTDAAVESRTRLTIARIFAEKGESAFRALEAEAVCACAQSEKLILALGGGALESEGTRKALSGLDETCVIFLDAPIEVMLARCMAQPEAAERPVLHDRDRLAARLAKRLPHYRQAHLTVATVGRTPEAVADAIIEAVANALPQREIPKVQEKHPISKSRV
ncbi:MAG: shikimate kinase [Silvibacterium sp.]|nr:shikimate kinase [Silvibacterium sp.]